MNGKRRVEDVVDELDRAVGALDAAQIVSDEAQQDEELRGRAPVIVSAVLSLVRTRLEELARVLAE